MSNRFREVSFEEAALAVNAAVVAAGPAPEGTERAAWLERVGVLARELADVTKHVRIDIMRVVKVIPIEGVLRVPAEQNNANRVNYLIDGGGRIKDSLWTEFLHGEELLAARERLQSLDGQLVRLTKVTVVEVGADGQPRLDDKGEPEQRSFARGPITLVETRSAPEPESIPVNDAKRRLLAVCRERVPEEKATEMARGLFSSVAVTDGVVQLSELEKVEALARRRRRRAA